MNDVLSWQNFLASFPINNPTKENTSSPCLLMDLSYLGLISIAGEDSLTFLQGQLSCDLNQLSGDHCLLGSLNTPKGRSVSTLTLAKLNNTIHMLLHKDLTADVLQVLGKYIVFSKASLEDQSNQLICFGVSGESARETISELLPPPLNDYDISHKENLHCVKIPGTITRYLFLAPSIEAQEAWTALSKNSAIVSHTQWQLENIEAGIAEVHAGIKEQFLPHNLNLHLTGGVSFEKGCYTGQEVIARMHYRAKLKTELFICELERCNENTTSTDQLDGLAILEATNRNLGEIINAAYLEKGKIKALAMLPTKELEEGLTKKKVQINNQEFNLNKVERPPYAINNK